MIGVFGLALFIATAAVAYLEQRSLAEAERLYLEEIYAPGNVR